MASGELSHDNLQRTLAGLMLDVPNSPRGAIKAGLDRGFVIESEYQPALDLIADRNTCSHIDKQSLILGVLARPPAQVRLMQAITGRLPRAQA